MADKTIGGYTSAPDVQLTTLFEIEYDPSGTPTSYKATGTQIRDMVQLNLTKATIAGGTVTSSTPIIDATQTWNSSGVAFTGIKLNVTNTASQSTSKLLDLQVGGSSVFYVDRAGKAWVQSLDPTVDNSVTLGQSNYWNAANFGGTVACGTLNANNTCRVGPSTSIPAGGTAGLGFRVSSATNFGMFFGSGAPTLSAAKGSIYLRSDGSTTNDRFYVNTDGSTTWTAVTTAA